MRRFPNNGYFQSAVGLFAGIIGPATGYFIDSRAVGTYTALVFGLMLFLSLALAFIGIRKARTTQET